MGVFLEFDLEKGDATCDPGTPKSVLTETTEGRVKTPKMEPQGLVSGFQGESDEAKTLTGEVFEESAGDVLGTRVGTRCAEAVLAVVAQEKELVGLVGVKADERSRAAVGETTETGSGEGAVLQGGKDAGSGVSPGRVTECVTRLDHGVRRTGSVERGDRRVRSRMVGVPERVPPHVESSPFDG